MSEEQIRAEFEAKLLASIRTIMEKHGYQSRNMADEIVEAAWQAALSAKSVPTLSDNEFSALVRCEQTMIDDNSYDIDATMMQKLADYGAVWHKGGGFYQITKFGDYLLKTKNGSITAAPQVPTDDDRVRELEKLEECRDFLLELNTSGFLAGESKLAKHLAERMETLYHTIDHVMKGETSRPTTSHKSKLGKKI